MGGTSRVKKDEEIEKCRESKEKSEQAQEHFEGNGLAWITIQSESNYGARRDARRK
jgi:hypothetical protein